MSKTMSSASNVQCPCGETDPEKFTVVTGTMQVSIGEGSPDKDGNSYGELRWLLRCSTCNRIVASTSSVNLTPTPLFNFATISLQPVYGCTSK